MQALLQTTYKEFFNLLSPKYITWDFYKSYLDKEPPFGEIGLIVAVRTYSRFIEELSRRERWCETILRNIEYSLSLDVVSSNEAKQKEAEKLFDMMFNLRGFPSGRSLWTSGTKQTLKDGSSGWNCTFKTINCLSAFSEIFYWLLIGAGTGFSVEEKYVSQLPRLNPNVTISHKPYEPVNPAVREEITEVVWDNGYLYLTKDDLITDDLSFYIKLKDKVTSEKATIVVGDSKESWCNSLRAYLHLLTFPNIKTISFEYDNVRSEGERIKTFGGRASGPKALIDLFNNMHKIIKRCDGIIDSVAALDINNCIGLNVVSGGVRRTAEIGLGSVTDTNFIEAKLNLYTDPAKEKYRAIRSMSNNSVLLYENPGLPKIKEIMTSIKSNGEPGFWIIGNSQKLAESPVAGTNPCFTGNMKLLTDKGYIEFKDLENQPVKVVNKDGNITESKVWSSGIKECIELKLSNKDKISCTPDHVWMTNEGDSEAKDTKNKQLVPFLKTPDLLVNYTRYGFIQGDGGLTRLNSSTHKGLEINIGKDDKDILDLFENLTYSSSIRSIYLNDVEDLNIIKTLGYDTRVLPNRKLPIEYPNFSKQQKAAFLKGCYSANGSVIKSGRVTYKSTCKELIEELQETLFLDFGIESYVTTNKAKAVEFSNGTYLCKESYDLNIGKFNDRVLFFNQINFVQKYKTEKLANSLISGAPYVMSITNIGEHKVYDFTEPETHWGVVNNYIAHNCAEAALDNDQSCNLTTTNQTSYVYWNEKTNKYEYNWDLAKQDIKLITRIGSRQTCASQWHPNWDNTQKRDRLLGVSMTGIQDAFDLLQWATKEKEYFYQWAKHVAVTEANSYHDFMGINRSTRVTLMKPEGTISQLPTVSSGIHKAYSPYYYRRIRFSKTDPLAQALLDAGLKAVPENNQGNDLYGKDCTTWVFTFPVKTNTKIRAIDEDCITQLESYKLAQVNYADRGHNISATITLNTEEYDTAATWINDNWNDIIGVSFLPRFDPVEGGSAAYPLMPYEPIDEKQYLDLKATLPTFTEKELLNILTKYESSYEEKEIEEGCSGSCPVR